MCIRDRVKYERSQTAKWPSDAESVHIAAPDFQHVKMNAPAAGFTMQLGDNNHCANLDQRSVCAPISTVPSAA
eukprot:10889980-Karenia_brevis.AAC.1